MKKGWAKVPLEELLDIEIDAVPVDPVETYPFAGVYGFGRGLFVRDSLKGSDTTYSNFHRLHEGQLVMSQPKGWEGAITVVPKEFQGRFLSSVFPTFRPREDKLSPAFLRLVTKCKWLWDALFEKSNGIGARRNSIYPAQLLEVSIPLPPLAEQQRIVAHLDAIESRLTRANKLREEARTEAHAFTISLHHHLSNGRSRRLDEMLRLDEEQEPIKADGSYPQVGIRSFGEGMFRKPPTLGSDTTYRSFNVLRAGKLVMSQVKGWEGAVAVCPDDLNGWFVSPEYRTFACRDGECDPDYLAHLVKTRWFQQHLAEATRGVGARRERIRPEMLLGIEIPFPDLAGQKTALKSIEHLTQALSLASQSAPHAEAILPSLLDRIFNA